MISGSTSVAPSAGPTLRRVGVPQQALYWILAIWILALGFRVLYVTQINPDQPLTGDGIYYHSLGNDLADGAGFKMRTRNFFGEPEEAADHPPGYPVLLGLASAIGLDSIEDHKMASALVGSLAVPLVGLAAGRLAGRRRDRTPSERMVGWAAIAGAGLAAVSVNMWVWDALVLSEPLVLTAIAAWFYALLVYDDHPGVGAALSGGLALGVAVATRSELLIAVAVFAVVLWRQRRIGIHRLALHGAMMGVGVAVLLGPWIYINLHRFHEPVIMTTGLGTTMVQANCDAAFSGPAIGYSDFTCFSRTRSLVTPEMDASEIDLLNREVATDYLKAHAPQVPLVMAARVSRTMGFFRPSQQASYMEGVELRGPHSVVYASLLSWQLLLPVGITGVVLARREGQLIAPVVAVGASILFAVALTQGADRYRMALEPLMLAYGGYALARCLAVVGRSTPALADTGSGRWLRKWSPTPEPRNVAVTSGEPPEAPTEAMAP